MMSTKKSNRWHSMQIEDVLRAFSTNRYKGLRSRDAIARKLKNGREPLWSTDPFEGAPSLFHQLCDYTTILFVLTVFLTVLFAHGAESVTVALLLVLSVGLRAFVIFATRKIVRQNARYRSPRCRVMRDGKCVYLFADQIVDGDIVLLSAGDTVPADVRLISGTLVTSEGQRPSPPPTQSGTSMCRFRHGSRGVHSPPQAGELDACSDRAACPRLRGIQARYRRDGRRRRSA